MSVPNISFPRQALLLEIERHCSISGCGARNFIGLTKPEAIEYRGFDCFQCRNWSDDVLRQVDVPDWWMEISGKTD